MVSLWKSSKNGEQEERLAEEDDEQQPRPTSSARSQNSRHSEDVNERTRLIPRQRQQPVGGYLDPDDPAVSLTPLGMDSSNIRAGEPIQFMECACSQMVRGPLPDDHLPMVGHLVRLYLRQSASNAFERLRLL